MNTLYITTDAINFRKRPNLNAKILNVIPARVEIIVTGPMEKLFYPALWMGESGYVHSNWLVKKAEPVPNPEPQPPNPGPDSSTRGQKLAIEAAKYVGYRYVWGTHGPNTFDCSGLMHWIYKQALGVELSPGSHEQFKLGVKINANNLQPGDLLFYNTMGDGAGHVGMYISPGVMINALNENAGVVKSNPFSSYFAPLFIGARRI